MILNSHNGHQMLVDTEDLQKLSIYKWYAYDWGGDRMYAFARINGRWTRMHRFIMNASNPEIFIDHKDRNGLNNQKSNLREATRSQNNANKKPTAFSPSRFLGVSKGKYDNGAQESPRTVSLMILEPLLKKKMLRLHTIKWPKLPKAFKNKWVKALRSGEFKQCRNYLKALSWDQNDKEYYSHCCLGVAGEICGVKKFENAYLLQKGQGLSGIKKVPRELRTAEELQDFLSQKNDSDHWSFKRIATWIEKNL